METRIQVRATQAGFYKVYRDPGTVFDIFREGDFSHNWMVRLSPMPVAPEAPVARPKIQPAPLMMGEPVQLAPVEASPVEEPRQKRKYTRKAKE